MDERSRRQSRSGPLPARRCRMRKVVGDWAWHENRVRAHAAVQGPDRRQSDPEQLGLEDLEQQDLRDRRCRTARACGAYVVRDLGASLGKTDAPAVDARARRAHRPGESQRSRGLRTAGVHRGASPATASSSTTTASIRSIVDTVTPADVVWTCRLLSRLSDEQWNDAFARRRLSARSGGALHCEAEVEDRGRTRARKAVGGGRDDAGVMIEIVSEPTRFSHHRRRRTRPALRRRHVRSSCSRSPAARSCSAASTRSSIRRDRRPRRGAAAASSGRRSARRICASRSKPVVVVEGGARRQDSVRQRVRARRRRRRRRRDPRRRAAAGDRRR